MSRFRRRLLSCIFGGGEVIPVPAGYTRVQYVHCSNDSYLDTGVLARESDTAIEVDFQIDSIDKSVQNNPRLVCSSQNSSTPFMLTCYTSKSPESMEARLFGAYSSLQRRFSLDTNRHIAGLDPPNSRWYADDVVHTFTSGTPQDTTNNILVARKNGSNSAYSGRIYGIKIWVSGVIARNFIMCRDNNNIAYAYDAVNDVVYSFTNVGTIPGPDA